MLIKYLYIYGWCIGICKNRFPSSTQKFFKRSRTTTTASSASPSADVKDRAHTGCSTPGHASLREATLLGGQVDQHRLMHYLNEHYHAELLCKFLFIPWAFYRCRSRLTTRRKTASGMCRSNEVEAGWSCGRWERWRELQLWCCLLGWSHVRLYLRCCSRRAIRSFKRASCFHVAFVMSSRLHQHLVWIVAWILAAVTWPDSPKLGLMSSGLLRNHFFQGINNHSNTTKSAPLFWING